MLDAEPAVELAGRIPVKHLKIYPLPAALDSDRTKSGHQPPSDPLSARRFGNKQIFEIHSGSAEPSREPGVEQCETGGGPAKKRGDGPPMSIGPPPTTAAILSWGYSGGGRPVGEGQPPGHVPR